MVREVVNMVCESGGKKPKEFMEEMGIETDEDAGVSLENIPVFEPSKRSFASASSLNAKKAKSG